MVVDSSVMLAVYFDEPQGGWAAERLKENRMRLLMSTVNLAEVLIRVGDRFPAAVGHVRDALLASGIRFVPPDIGQAIAASEARTRYPLNLGDCFAYALAVAENCPILTLDRDFRHTDRQVVMP